jgi:hypothetical protein
MTHVGREHVGRQEFSMSNVDISSYLTSIYLTSFTSSCLLLARRYRMGLPMAEYGTSTRTLIERAEVVSLVAPFIASVLWFVAAIIRCTKKELNTISVKKHDDDMSTLGSLYNEKVRWFETRLAQKETEVRDLRRQNIFMEAQLDRRRSLGAMENPALARMRTHDTTGPEEGSEDMM